MLKHETMMAKTRNNDSENTKQQWWKHKIKVLKTRNNDNEKKKITMQRNDDNETSKQQWRKHDTNRVFIHCFAFFTVVVSCFQHRCFAFHHRCFVFSPLLFRIFVFSASCYRCIISSL
jgi:hypothetical protein